MGEEPVGSTSGEGAAVKESPVAGPRNEAGWYGLGGVDVMRGEDELRRGLPGAETKPQFVPPESGAPKRYK